MQNQKQPTNQPARIFNKPAKLWTPPREPTRGIVYFYSGKTFIFYQCALQQVQRHHPHNEMILTNRITTHRHLHNAQKEK